MQGKLISDVYPVGGARIIDTQIGRFYDVSFDTHINGGDEIAFFTDDEGVHRAIKKGRSLFDFAASAVQIPDEDAPVCPAPNPAIDHPAHYNQGGIECIAAIRASMSLEAFRGFLKGNQLKYLWRYESKGKSAEDIGKSNWYGAELEKSLKGESSK